MSSSGIKSLKAKLLRLEQKAKVGSSKDFYASLTDEQLEALCQLTDAELEEGDLFPEEEAISFLTDCLDGDERMARYLWLNRQSLPPDPTFQRMSDDELTEYILRARDECHRLAVELEESE